MIESFAVPKFIRLSLKRNKHEVLKWVKLNEYSTIEANVNSRTALKILKIRLICSCYSADNNVFPTREQSP